MAPVAASHGLAADHERDVAILRICPAVLGDLALLARVDDAVLNEAEDVRTRGSFTGTPKYAAASAPANAFASPELAERVLP